MDGEKFSYSKLNTFDTCPYRFKLRYEDKNFSSSSSLAMEIGTIAHKCKELVAQDLIDGNKPNYEAIEHIYWNGFDQLPGKDPSGKDHGVEHIPGANELKQKYIFDWMAPDNKSGLTYDQKSKLFCSNLVDMENDPIWHPIDVEVPFTIDYNDHTLHGFIDKLEANANGDIRVVDYKTSKAVFRDDAIKTAMQMVIYSLAVEQMYGKLPVQHLYDFVFIGKKQHACTSGYLNRGKKKLDKWFNLLDECRETNIWRPSPSPLCHWCDFCATNNDADVEMKFFCPYHSLWTPSNKTFAVASSFEVNQSESKPQSDFWF